MRTRLGRLEGLRRSRRAIQRVETIHLKHEAVRTANDKPKHGNHAANVHITAAARLGISTAAPKLGRGKRSHPPKMSKPPVSASPQRGPTFPSSPPHLLISTLSSKPPHPHRPAAAISQFPSSVPFQICQCRSSQSNLVAIVILTRGPSLPSRFVPNLGQSFVALGPASLPWAWRRNSAQQRS